MFIALTDNTNKLNQLTHNAIAIGQPTLVILTNAPILKVFVPRTIKPH